MTLKGTSGIVNPSGPQNRAHLTALDQTPSTDGDPN